MHSFFIKHPKAPLVEFILLIFLIVGILFAFVFVGMYAGVFNVRGSISERNAFFNEQSLRNRGESAQAIKKLSDASDRNMVEIRKTLFPEVDFSWIHSPEWNTLKDALVKDKDIIKKAAYDAGISPRLLVSVVIAEQLRFFTSDRESFKKFFEPLKILGTLSQFSLGVSGVKQETAITIEDNLKNKQSPYYIPPGADKRPGTPISEILNLTDFEKEKYGTADIGRVRFDRLTDAKDHYYSYLYTALFIRQVQEQWKKAGFDISDRPEILATLFNLGFEKSVPKANPQVAGSEIVIESKKYTFGELAFSFFYSGELATIFGY